MITKPSETKLAKTGTYADVLAVLVPLIAAVGTIAYLASRRKTTDMQSIKVKYTNFFGEERRRSSTSTSPRLSS